MKNFTLSSPNPQECDWVYKQSQIHMGSISAYTYWTYVLNPPMWCPHPSSTTMSTKQKRGTCRGPGMIKETVNKGDKMKAPLPGFFFVGKLFNTASILLLIIDLFILILLVPFWWVISV
jgi:hypothetical protein